MKLLVTGATGFIGRNLLLSALSTRPYSQIVAPVRDPSKLLRLLAEDGYRDPPPNLDIVQWPLRVRLSDIDHAVHCAGVLFGATREEYFAGNVRGSLDLLAKLPARCRIIVLSSLSAGGPTPEGQDARREDDPDAPITWYGESKLAMERRIVAEFGGRFAGLVILRPPMVLGPRDRATLPLFRLAGSPIRVKPGIYPKTYSWISSDDLSDAIYAALECASHTFSRRVYYVASRMAVSDVSLILDAGRVVNRRGLIIPIPHAVIRLASMLVSRSSRLCDACPSLVPSRVSEILPDRWIVDGSEFSAETSWNPKTDLSSALESACRWYVETGRLKARMPPMCGEARAPFRDDLA